MRIGCGPEAHAHRRTGRPLHPDPTKDRKNKGSIAMVAGVSVRSLSDSTSVREPTKGTTAPPTRPSQPSRRRPRRHRGPGVAGRRWREPARIRRVRGARPRGRDGPTGPRPRRWRARWRRPACNRASSSPIRAARAMFTLSPTSGEIGRCRRPHGSDDGVSAVNPDPDAQRLDKLSLDPRVQARQPVRHRRRAPQRLARSDVDAGLQSVQRHQTVRSVHTSR